MLKRGDHYGDTDLGETPMLRDGQMLVLGERPEEASRQGRDTRHGRGRAHIVVKKCPRPETRWGDTLNRTVEMRDSY